MRRHVMIDHEWPRSRFWLCHFLYSRHERPYIHWDAPCVDEPLRRSAGEWLSWQIQINDGSRQRLIDHATTECATDPAYIQSLRLFTREEHHQREIVERWLDESGHDISPQGRVRHLMRLAVRPLGLRFELSLLLLGEIATLTMNRLMLERASDTKLAGVLNQLILDHEQHIAFHSERLTAEYADFNFIRRNLRRSRLRGMFATLVRGIAWQQRRTLKAMNVSQSEFRRDAQRNFEAVLSRMVPYHREALLESLGQQRDQRYEKPARV